MADQETPQPQESRIIKLSVSPEKLIEFTEKLKAKKKDTNTNPSSSTARKRGLESSDDDWDSDPDEHAEDIAPSGSRIRSKHARISQTTRTKPSRSTSTRPRPNKRTENERQPPRNREQEIFSEENMRKIIAHSSAESSRTYEALFDQIRQLQTRNTELENELSVLKKQYESLESKISKSFAKLQGTLKQVQENFDLRK